MKILVTGCMGFIGSNLVPGLLNLRHEVVGIDSLMNTSIAPTDRMKGNCDKTWGLFSFYRADCTDLSSIQSICAATKPDAIIHLAGVGSVPRSFENPEMTCKNNELGFVNMMQIARLIRAQKFVFASSSSVYGSNQHFQKKEGEEGQPLSPYALSKRMNEDFANIWGKAAGIPYVGLRFFNVYGPGQLVGSEYAAVIPKFINADEPIVHGDGTTTRDFTFVDDVCTAIIKSLFVKQSGICNVGTGRGTSLLSLLRILGKENKAKYVQERRGDIKVSIASTDRAKQFLDFEAQYSIEQGLQKTAQFYKQYREMEIGL